MLSPTPARPSPWCTGAALLAVLTAILLALTGCVVIRIGGSAIGSVHRSGTAPLHVVSTKHATLAVASVTIDGQGPFPFIVDTGASSSVVDSAVASKIGLKATGKTEQLSGVGCQTTASQAKVSSWQVGHVALPAATVSVLPMLADTKGPKIGGLLGSDVLSEFGVAALDYQDQQLQLGPAAVGLSARSAISVPVKVVYSHGAVLAVAPVFVQSHGPYPFIVDTGAAESVLNRELVQKLSLPVVSSQGEAAGLACRVRTSTVTITGWRAASVSLPGNRIVSVDLPEPRKGEGIQGLLGSGTLSTYGTIAIDYSHQRLLLARRGPG
jgi:predicted aspartyl protease